MPPMGTFDRWPAGCPDIGRLPRQGNGHSLAGRAARGEAVIAAEGEAASLLDSPPALPELGFRASPRSGAAPSLRSGQRVGNLCLM